MQRCNNVGVVITIIIVIVIITATTTILIIIVSSVHIRVIIVGRVVIAMHHEAQSRCGTRTHMGGRGRSHCSKLGEKRGPRANMKR